MIKIKKHMLTSLYVLPFILILISTTFVNFYDYNNIGIRSNISSNIWNLIVSLFGFIWGIKYIYKKEIGLGISFIVITSIIIFQNILLVLYKIH